MPTLEERIADLQDQAGRLLDLPQQIADTAQARINQIGSYWDARVQEMYTTAYVHQQTGDDDADGTESAPLRSVEEALHRTPPGGVCEVRLMTNYHFAEIVPVSQTHLFLRSDSTLRHAVTLERKSHTLSNGDIVRISGGVRLRNRGSVFFNGLRLVVPPLDGAWGSYPLAEEYSGFAQTGNTSEAGRQLVKITYCDIEVPAEPFCAVVGNGSRYPLELFMSNCTATDQPLTGRLLSGASDTNGTDTTTLPWLLTNLTTV